MSKRDFEFSEGSSNEDGNPDFFMRHVATME